MMTHSSHRGFTLIELIVSVGIFALVMLVAMSAYFNLISLDRRARVTNHVVTSLSFAIDSMMRGIRTGTQFHCYDGTPDANGNSGAFGCTQLYYTDSTLPSSANVVTFFRKSDGTIGRCESSSVCISDANAASLTDTAITINSMTFYVTGAGAGNNAQPQVRIVIKASMAVDAHGPPVSFVIQESATQRLIDL